MTRMRKAPISVALVLLLALAGAPAAEAQGTTAPSADDLANPVKMGLLLADDWTTPIGHLTIKQASDSAFDVYVGHLYREGSVDPAYIFEGLAPDRTGALVGTWRRSGSSDERPARLESSRSDIKPVRGRARWLA